VNETFVMKALRIAIPPRNTDGQEALVETEKTRPTLAAVAA
jgi:hypothetical protein